jgi:Ni/Fe-hydrogenase subunit HybB-like protein
MTPLVESPTARRTASRAAGVVVLVAAGALAWAAATGQDRVALAALAASWLFFAGLSAGSVALAAVIRLTGGRWARVVLPVADAMSRFFGAALALQCLLLLGARTLLPWASEAGWWALAALALRQLVPTAVLFGLGAWHVRAARRPALAGRARVVAVAYLLTYALALWLWAYDFILSLSPSPPPSALPALFAVGAFLSGLALVALLVAVQGAGGPDVRHDLGKLLFAFAVLWSYLVWAIYLAAWYGNLPEEAAPLLRRWQGPYRLASLAVLGAVLVFPFGLLFPERHKRRRDALGVGAAVVLAGLWLERFLLVLPSLPIAPTPAAVGLGLVVAMGVAAAFAWSALLRPPPVEVGLEGGP